MGHTSAIARAEPPAAHEPGRGDDRNRMVEANLGLVRFVLVQQRGLWEQRLEEQDAFQEGVIGLLRAVQTYDPSRGFAFSAYAIWQIRGAISHAARRHTHQETLSLDQPIGEDDDTTLAESIPAPEEQRPDREVVARLLVYLTLEERRIVELRYHLVALDHQKKTDPFPRPYEMVAQALGIPWERVKRKEERALWKLRAEAARQRQSGKEVRSL